MKLAIIGGGGFRTPLVYRALAADAHERRIEQVWLHDIDATRLAGIERVLSAMAAQHPRAPRLHTTTDLDRAVAGADFVFSAVRTGGMAARVADERIALNLGVLGQETIGAGGIAYGLRTVPVALDLAQRVRRNAPDAWVINFTNPAGLITEAMSAILPGRVIGICDSPIAMARRAIALVGGTEEDAEIDYVGLNHLGWLRALRVQGKDRLPALLADDTALMTMEEGRLFGPEWLRTLGAIPNEYLYYYDFAREALAGIAGAARTRGEYLVAQQDAFYAALADPGRDALGEWDRVRRERNATYMQQERGADDERDAQDVEGGGYEAVALAVMAAIARDEPARLILNVVNGEAVPGLPADGVVEVVCDIDRQGPVPQRRAPLSGGMLGLTQQVKAVDRLVIDAATTGSPQRALQAFATHPLIDSVTVARRLLADYRAAHPALEDLFSGHGRGG